MARRLISCGKFSDSFVLGKYLSEGSFAKVFMATAVGRNPEPGKGLPPPPAEFAVKRTARKGLSDSGKQDVYDEVRDIYDRYMVNRNIYIYIPGIRFRPGVWEDETSSVLPVPGMFVPKKIPSYIPGI